MTQMTSTAGLLCVLCAYLSPEKTTGDMGVMGPADTRLAVTVVDGNASCAAHLDYLRGRPFEDALAAWRKDSTND